MTCMFVEGVSNMLIVDSDESLINSVTLHVIVIAHICAIKVIVHLASQ